MTFNMEVTEPLQMYPSFLDDVKIENALCEDMGV